MTLSAIPYIVLLGFLFGSTLVASRFSVGQFQPTTYIGLRMILAALGHVAVYTLSYQRRRWPTRPGLWGHAAMLGVFGTAVPMTCIVTSLQYQSAGLTGVLLTTGPAITVLMAHFWLADERLSWRKSLGVGLALGGALLLAVKGENGLPAVHQADPRGYVLVFTAVIFAGGMTIYARKYMQAFNSFDVASVRMLAAALTVMPLSVLWVGFDLHRVTAQGYLALGYAALVGTFGGMMLAFYTIKRFGATASAMTNYVIPVVSGLGGVLVLEEHITEGMLIGIGLITAGLSLLHQRESG